MSESGTGRYEFQFWKCVILVICVRCDSKVRFMRSGMEFENRPAKREVKNIGPHRASYQWDRLMQLHKSEELIVSYIHQGKPMDCFR